MRWYGWKVEHCCRFIFLWLFDGSDCRCRLFAIFLTVVLLSVVISKHLFRHDFFLFASCHSSIAVVSSHQFTDYLYELICVVKIEEKIVTNCNSFNISAKSKVKEQLDMNKIHSIINECNAHCEKLYDRLCDQQGRIWDQMFGAASQNLCPNESSVPIIFLYIANCATNAF